MTKPLLLALALGLAVVAAAPTVAARPPKGQKPGAGKKAKPPKAPAPGPAAESPKHAAAAPLELHIPLRRVTLENGLRVVVDVDRTSPTVAVTVTYDVGSRNEERGRSGFAHLFEHMMFQGSRNVPKGDHFRLVSGHGGQLNGTTNNDRTNYYETLPDSELALGLWLEADRMRSLDVSQANFENQRQVVEEEYRMRISNVAYATSSVRLEELVYQGYWPYEHSVIGSMADLDGARLEWVRDFHARHYGPNNAALVIAGDVDADEAVALAHKYFDAIPRIAIAPFEHAALPEQTSQRTAVVKDDIARSPGVRYGWATPPARSPDAYALELAAVILGEGESSRLHQLLVRDRALAQRVSAGAGARRGAGLFQVNAVLAEGARAADVERLIEAEIKALATRGPTDAEVEKARRQVEARFVLGLQANLNRARLLGEYEVFHGDAGLLAGELPRYFAVTREDIQRAVAAHLGPTRRTLVETLPAAPAEGAEAKPRAHAAAPAPATKKAAPSGKGKKARKP